MASLVSSTKRFTASGDLQRKSRSTTVGGYTGVDTKNKYINYEQMSLMSPHIFVPLHKTALTICKNFHFESKNGNTEKVEEYDAWARRVNLNSKIRTLVRLSCRNGTFVARWEDETGKTAPEFMSFEPLMMEKTTIIPKGFNPDDAAKNAGDIILTTPIGKFMVNEGNQNKKLVKDYKPEEVVYVALYPYDYRQKDIKDRETYGLYGISLLESIVDIFNKYMDIIEGFALFVKKYGAGRYHINYKVLEDMIKDGNVEQAIVTLEKMKEQHALLAANDDIVSAGCDIKTLDTGSGSLSVTDFKKSLENDIEIGLMQSPITMGKGEGSTYASGYVSESDRLLTLEGLQQEFEAIINDQIVKYRELKMGGDELTWQDDIYLKFEQISELNLPLADVIQAIINDMITVDEGREFIDLEPAKEEIDNGMNPTKIQAETAKAQMELQEKTATMQAEATKIQAQAVKSQGRPETGGKSNTQVKTEKSQKTVEKKANRLKV